MLETWRKCLAPASIVVCLACSSVPRGDQRASADTTAVNTAIRAAIGGSWAEGKQITPNAVQIAHYPRVQFFLGQVDGPHSILTGLAARLPDGSVLPMGSAATRRMLAPYARVNLQDSSDVLLYSLSLAKLEAGLSSNAQLVDADTDVPPVMRQRLAATNLSVQPPRITRQADQSVLVRFDTWSTPSVLHRNEVLLARTRFSDVLVKSELLLGHY